MRRTHECIFGWFDALFGLYFAMSALSLEGILEGIPSMTSPSNAPPVIAGLHYVRPLGSGGFADILLYEQDFPRRPVAVKVMFAQVSDPEHAALFEREADALARVSAHPSIVTIFSASVSADGRPYLVLEYCPTSIGSTFRTEPMSVRDVLDLGVSIGSALETCHRSGILHRDIKPSNLLVNSYGATVLSDFGIASSPTAGDEEHFGLSIPWSAPEIINGTSSGTVQSEVWGLTATLYALLAGKSPFELSGVDQNTDQLLSERIQAAKYQPIGRPDVPEALEAVLRQGLSKDPALRQSSALEVAGQLRMIQHSMGLPLGTLQIAAPSSFEGTSGKTTSSRTPVRSEVPTESKRRRAQEMRKANLNGTTSRSQTSAAPDQDNTSFSKGKVALLVAGVAVLTALIVVALMLWMGG